MDIHINMDPNAVYALAISIVVLVAACWILWYDRNYKLSGDGAKRARKIRRMNE